MIIPINYKERMVDFLKVTMLMDEEELKAIDEIIPMTQDLFNRIVDKMMGEGIGDFFDKFILKYPDFLVNYGRALEEELDKIPLPDDYVEESPEEIQAGLEKLKAKIRKEYGNDAI